MSSGKEMDNAPHIVFLHVGNETLFPTLLVRSLRMHNPNASIVQCSDPCSPKIPGVDEVFRFVGDVSNLMTFRLWCFSSLDITIPTLFLDTDMLCVGSVDPAQAIQDADVAVCAREFGCQDIINTSFREMDLSEYSGKTFGEVYPYVACATITRSSKFWKDCLQNLQQLHPKFHFWYGDQEAIRNVANSGAYRVKFLKESIYGCLPDQRDGPTSQPGQASRAPQLYHFKGGVGNR